MTAGDLATVLIRHGRSLRSRAAPFTRTAASSARLLGYTCKPLRIAALVAVLYAALAIGSGTSAYAQDAPPAASDPSRDAEARALFDAGRTSFDAGRYADALGYFERAHTLSGRPALLFNIATSHDRLRHDADALRAFEAYLESVPNAPNRAEVEARITLLRDAVAARDAELARAAQSVAVTADDADQTTPNAAPAAPQARSARSPVFAWIAGGVALASAGVATWAWVDANARYSDLEDGCFASGGCTQDELDASGVSTRVTLTNVFGIVAIVAAVGAVTLFFIEAPDDDDPTAASAAVAIGPGGVVLHGAF